MDPLDEIRPETSTATWTVKTTALVRCAGAAARWEIGLATGLCALCARIGQVRDVLVSTALQPAAPITLPPRTTLAELASMIADSAAIPEDGRFEARVAPLGDGTFGGIPGVAVSARAAGDGVTVRLDTSGVLAAPVMARSLGSLLDAGAADPGLDIDALPILHAVDRENVLRAWNATTWRPDALQPLHRSVEAQVWRTPAATALIDGPLRWTYAFLNCAANRLAARLRAEGAGVGTTVGLCVPRSAAMVVGMLGVLKSGSAFVPLDMNHPPARLNRMCARARPRVLLFSRADAGPAAALGHAGPRLCIEDVIEAPGDDGDLPDGATAQDPAYVIFTSGSTGEPKGVVGLHRGMSNRIQWVLEQVPLEPDTICCQKAALGFIDSIGEVLSPLVCGRPLVIVSERAAGDPAALVEFLAQHQITRVTTVPTLLRMVLAAVGDLRAKLPLLRTWICSGEELSADLVGRFFECCDAELYNFYGPSEASIEVSVWRCDRGSPSSPVPIGRPIGNTQLYVLDAAMRPLVPGMVGELHIGGLGLARGYLDDPQRTAISFVRDPFSDDPEARLYRTGDLARHRSDGVLEFIGRIGRDVKVRGNRVALGEVESALAALPGIDEAAVVARSDSHGASRLLAYIVPAGSAPPALETLHGQLAAALPAYMIPSWFVCLDGLPRTTSGKIDRSRLPAPHPARVLREQNIRPLSSEAEHQVARSFAETLRVPVTSADDDFLTLGGDSLLATFLLSHLASRHGLTLPLRDFFARPTVGEVARRLESLDPDPEARRRAAGGRPTIAPGGDFAPDGVLPLCHAQERLWFLAQLDGGAGYAVSTALRLEGPLLIEALHGALDVLWRRHAALRANFPERDGRPVCVVRDPAPLALDHADAGASPGGTAAAEVRIAGHIRRTLHDAPFDLAADPLVRATLFAHGPTDHTLVLTIHHIVCDGVSVDILVRELAALYEAGVTGSPPDLPEHTESYADHARRERAQEHDPRAQALAGVWGRRMAGAPPVLELPLDHPRPPVWSEQGASFRFSLGGKLAGSLHRFARQTGTSLFMVAHAAFAALLARLSGQDDLCVGVPVANRTHAEVSDLVGMFVNTVVLRTRVFGDDSFRTLLNQVRDDCLEAFEHQDLPFERLVRQMKPERSLSRAPVVQVTFALERPPPRRRAAGIEIRARDLDSGIALFDLSLTLAPTDHDIEGVATYSTALFEPETIARWMGYYRRLLEAGVREPDIPIARLPLLDDAEHRMLRDFGTGETMAPPVPWRSVIAQFEAQAGRSPDAVALVAGDTRLSYRRLNALAGTLSARLLARGVGPGTLVAICGRRSADLVVAVLAVMKAGGAWLPLDPGYPAARLRFMLRDSGSTLLLAHRETLQHLAADVLPPWLPLDPEDDGGAFRDAAPAGAAADRRPPPIAPEHPAYLIYTSGSTGKPKGVIITHGALESTWRAWDRAYCLTGRCRSHLQTASFSFDVFVGDLVRALCSGAKLVMADRETLLDPPALLDLADAEGIDCADLSPMVMRLLEEHLSAVGRDLSFLKLLVLGTDAWTVDAHRRWQALLGPDSRFLNAYGVTEATVASTYYEVRQGALPAAGPVPIGIPLPGETIRIVDRHLTPVPVGMAGEICIGGAGVARGYHNRPALDAERFFVDPDGRRHYRTGDLGRWRADGVIEFLGRADAQVKIRGFRVEPGEVEGVIAAHPAVRQVAVVALPDPTGGHALRAAVVFRDHAAIGIPELLTFAAQHLPDHMLPASVLALEALPASPNGKIDRRAVAALEDCGAGTTRAGARPRTPEEAVIAEIFCRVLGLERIGVDDNFFVLGGHSLLATRAVSQIRSTLGVTLKVRSFFEAPTVAGLARQARELRGRTPGIPAAISEPPVRSTPRKVFEEPCSAAQTRLLFLHHLGGDGRGDLAYDIPALFHLRGPLDLVALERSLARIVERHEVLRTTFVLPDGTTLDARQRIHPDLPMPVTVVRYGRDAADGPDTPEAHIASVIERPFDLENGPLIRAVVYRRDDDDHVLLLHMHHLVSDAWSLGVYVRELRVHYADFRAGRSSSLPPLRRQYRDFAAWQRALLETEPGAAQLGYWRNQLAGAPALTALPGDRPRPAALSHRGGVLHHTLDAALVADLGRLGQRLHASLYMLLLAALGVLLYRRTGQTDLCIGSPIANRGDGAFEDLIGFFVNTLVMRVRLEGDLRFTGLVSRIRETALDAYDAPCVPFDRLVDELQPERSLSHAPLFQIVLALQNVPTEDVTLEGLTVVPRDIHNGTAKFDLVIIAEHRDKELRLDVEYSADLFDRATVERLVHSYETILRGAVADPDAPVSRLPVLTPSERVLLETTWTHTGLDLGEPRCLHHAFESQAARSPEAIALAGPAARPGPMTWQTLDRCANALAHELQGLGVGPDATVGIFCDRGVEQVVAVLGTLKAGGAYVALDPVHPAARLRDMAADARLRVVLTHGAVPCPDLGVPQLALSGSPMRQAPHGPLSGVTPRDLAYVTYTSGSTGRPKGIAMHHAAVWNLIAWHRHETPLAAPTTIQYAPLGFDVSFQEIFATFADGGTLVLIDEDDRRDPFRLWRVVAQTATQRLFLPTAALKPFAAAAVALPVLPLGLREVWVGGEQMLIDNAIRAAFRRLPRCRLINYYGPSECHAVTWAPLPGDVGQWRDTPHVGRPIANTRIHILDSLGQHVPIGVEGELCIAGACVATGYVGRPAQTAASFVPDPFPGDGAVTSSAPPRLYRTGDRALHDADGNIHVLSRHDGQAKIRGFRIETGEVEAVLARHPDIASAAVAVDGVGGDGARLLAWVAARPGANLDGRDVGAYLRGILPDYMVPSSVMVLDRLPVNANGKIDRGRLHAPAAAGAADGPAVHQPPRDAREAQVAEVFAALLGLPHVGRDDSFFDLGGNSILAMSLVVRLRAATGMPLSVAALIQHATPTKIARHLQGHGAAAPVRAATLVQLRTDRWTHPPLFCVHPAGGNVVCYEPLSRALTRPFYALQSPGLNTGEVPLRRIEEMASSYLEAIRAHAQSGAPARPLHLAGWSMGGIVAFEMARQHILAGGEVAMLILLDTDAPARRDPAVPLDLQIARALVEEHHAVLGRSVDLDEAALGALPETGRLDYIVRAAEEAGAIPGDLGTEGLRRLLRVFSCNLEAMLAYEAGSYAGPLTIVSARDRTGSGAASPPDRGWRTLVSGPLAVHEIPGDHYTFLRPEQVGTVAQIIEDALSGQQRMNAGFSP